MVVFFVLFVGVVDDVVVAVAVAVVVVGVVIVDGIAVVVWCGVVLVCCGMVRYGETEKKNEKKKKKKVVAPCQASRERKSEEGSDQINVPFPLILIPILIRSASVQSP